MEKLNINWKEINELVEKELEPKGKYSGCMAEEANKYRRRPPAGIYKMEIVDTEINTDKQYIKLTLDWVDGEYKGFGKYGEEHFGNKWNYANAYLSYKASCQKSFYWSIDAIAKSNELNILDLQPEISMTGGKALVGKVVGVILKDEEYTKSNGEVGLKYNSFPKLIDLGEIDKKKNEVKTIEAVDAYEIDGDEMPF